MMEKPRLIPTIFEGWQAYQNTLITALKPLDQDQLALRAAQTLRSIDLIARHIVSARARWFYLLMGEGGEEFKTLGNWDRRGRKARSAEELVEALEHTWTVMQEAIARWTPTQWQQTWPGEGADEPEVITREWVLWHLIEHDLHHGGEISLTLGVHGIPGFAL